MKPTRNKKKNPKPLYTIQSLLIAGLSVALFLFHRRISKRLKFKNKTIARNSLLARNLESVLSKLQEHCQNFSPDNIKNVLLFFHDAKNTPPTKTNKGFTPIPIDYSKEIKGNFVTL
jgi:hypothetical protein